MMDDDYKYDPEFDEDEPDADTKGLTPEEIKYIDDAIKRYGPTPDLTERYVDSFTGEVLNEGGPDTPEVHALREEAAQLYRDRMRREEQKSENSD